MSATPSTERRTPGLLDRTIVRLFMNEARVSAVQAFSPKLRLIELTADGLRQADWSAGQKIEIALGSVFTKRTYTPLHIDPVAGKASILAHLHGKGPGSAWAASTQPGDVCHLIGPRSSLRAESQPGPLVLFGDDTSIGLSIAAERQRSAHPLHHLIETDDAGPVRSALQTAGLKHAEVHARRAGDAHLGDIQARLESLAGSGAQFVLSGRAASIQRLRQALRSLEVPASRVQTKAYWAEGKVGMD